MLLDEQLFTSLRGAVLTRMAEALQPALTGREKIKFEGKRHGFGSSNVPACFQS